MVSIGTVIVLCILFFVVGFCTSILMEPPKEDA